MSNDKLSVIIPSIQPQYLQRTVEDILLKAKGDIEIIIILDGYWHDVAIDDPRVRTVHFGRHIGMRGGINAGMTIATGDYMMKTDEHCMFDEGFDEKLKADCEDGWVVIPRRKRLDAEKWEVINDGRPDIDYMYVEYPFLKPFDKTQGLHGAIWNLKGREEFAIDDTPTMQGSCYFMSKKTWDTYFPTGLDSESYGPFTQEAQEISMAAWLSGGRVIVNKKTWYAHFHKGKRGKGYGFSTAQYKQHCEWNERGRVYCIARWINDPKFKQFIEKFPTMPNWENWEERIKEDKLKDYSTLKYKDDEWLSNMKGQELKI